MRARSSATRCGDLVLGLAILVGRPGGQFVQVLLEHALVGVERAIAAHGVLDDLVDLHAGGIERHQDRLRLDLGRQRADVLALSISATLSTV